MFFPAFASRSSSRNAPVPPRVEEPRAASTPYQSNTRAMYSPSFDFEIITLIGRRHFECSMSSKCECQNARMYCGVPVMFSTFTCRTRSVAWRVRMNSEAMNERSFTLRRAVYLK